MLVVSNISAAFESYLDLMINIVLLSFGKYPCFGSGQHTKRAFYQLRNLDNLLIKSSAKSTILGSLSGQQVAKCFRSSVNAFPKIAIASNLPVWCLLEMVALYHRVQIVLLKHCNSCAQK